MDSFGRCGFAQELEAAAAEQQRKGRQSPANMVAYSRSAAALREVARSHAQTCKRCQSDRLLEDEAATRSEIEALAVLDGALVLSGPAHSLAVAVMAFAEDRRGTWGQTGRKQSC